MPGDLQALLDLAADVADGAEVDWVAAQRRLEESGQGGLVKQLRVLSDVAVLQRSNDDEDAAPLASASTTRARDPEPDPSTMGTARLGDRWGELILLEEIGSGSFGTVYKAHDRNLDRTVALKLLRPKSSTDGELDSRVLREGRTLARVRHPNVVTVHGASTSNDRVGLWMEFVRGETLRKAIRHGRTLSAEEASAIGIKLCQALAAVHAADLVHADIKAQNVMREAGGRIVLMDFGAVQPKAIADAAADGVAGTPLYMAPELFERAAPSVASDIYALGVLLFHLVTNRFPVEASTKAGLVLAHAQRERQLLRDVRPDLPEDFVQVVEKASTPEPGARFQSAGSMERALAAVVSPTAAQVGTSDGRSETPAWIRRSVIAASGVLSLVFLGYISSAAFNVFLRIPPQFTSANPANYLVSGYQAMFPIVIYWISWLIVSLGLVGLWWLGAQSVELLGPNPEAHLPIAWRKFYSRVESAGRNPSARAAVSLLLAVLGWLGLTWYFSEIFGVLGRLADQQPGQIVDVTVLSPASDALHRVHALAYSVLSFLIALALWFLPSPGTHDRASRSVRAMKGVMAIVFGVTLITAVLPYRLLWKNEAERVSFDDRRAYVLGQTDAELLIYVPDSTTNTHVIVDRDDTRIERSTDRFMESVFTIE